MSGKGMVRLPFHRAAGIRSAFADGEITGESVKMLILHLEALKHNQATLTWLLIE